jgi:hypothetical protein
VTRRDASYLLATADTIAKFPRKFNCDAACWKKGGTDDWTGPAPLAMEEQIRLQKVCIPFGAEGGKGLADHWVLKTAASIDDLMKAAFAGRPYTKELLLHLHRQLTSSLDAGGIALTNNPLARATITVLKACDLLSLDSPDVMPMMGNPFADCPAVVGDVR